MSDVFVASGIEMADANTFTALFYGYEVRGKVRLPTAPTVEFYFYANVYIESREQAQEFLADFEEKFGHAKIRFTDKYISILLDIGSMEAPQVKERLGAVGNFMISNSFGAIAMLPEEPEPEPEPEPQPQQMQQQRQPQMQQQRQPQRQQQPQQQRQPQRKPQQPVYEEPKVPFEEYKVLGKLTQMFINGVNKTSQNMFTTLYHGYNLVGKMLTPFKEDVEIIFYGQLMNNVTDEFEALKIEMNEKYGKVPMRMIGGSCDIILYLEDKDPAVGKEMLSCISGFMMKNNIAAINLPNTVGKTLATYTAEDFQNRKPSGPRSLGGYSQQRGGSAPSQMGSMGRTYPSGQTAPSQQGGEDDGNSFAKNFLKKFSKKP